MGQKKTTEHEWLEGIHSRMVVHVRDTATERKWRLLACEYINYYRLQITYKPILTTIDLIEKCLDETPSEAYWQRASGMMLVQMKQFEMMPLKNQKELRECAIAVTTPNETHRDYRVPMLKDREVHVALMRDLFGNPFRPAAFDAAWRDSNSVPIARAMYTSRDFTAAPVLADALEDAGCTEAAILDHLRDPAAVHVRGCWAIDLVLGKS